MRRKILAAILLVYLCVVAALTVVPTHLSFIRVRNNDSNHVNLIPLDYSFRCFRQDEGMHPHLTAFCLRNTLGNVLFQDLRFDAEGKERPDFPINRPAWRGPVSCRDKAIASSPGAGR